MGSITKLHIGTDYSAVSDVADMIKAGQITHGIMIYRKEDGDLCYRLLGEANNHVTYMLGMVERIKLDLYNQARSESCGG